MKLNYHNTIEHSTELTDKWVRSINYQVDWDDPNRSFQLLRATLHALRDALPINEAIEFAAQMPLVIKAYYFEGWNPSSTLDCDRDKAGFVDLVSQKIPFVSDDEAERAISAVFLTLNEKISSGEINDARQSVRKHLRKLWPEPVDTGA